MERGEKDQIAVELTGHYDDLETIGVSQDGAGAGRYTISIEYIFLYLLLWKLSKRETSLIKNIYYNSITIEISLCKYYKFCKLYTNYYIVVNAKK